jgi:hypothetical protein
MKCEAKGFGPRPSKYKPGRDVRDRCGKLTLTAENESDASMIALVYRNLFGMGTKRKMAARIAAYLWMLKQVDGFEETEELKSMRPDFDAHFAKNPLPKERKSKSVAAKS